jgi:hypothetical protein
MGKERCAAPLPCNPVRELDTTGTQDFIGPDFGLFIAMNPSCLTGADIYLIGELDHDSKLRVTVP